MRKQVVEQISARVDYPRLSVKYNIGDSVKGSTYVARLIATFLRLNQAGVRV